MQRIYLLKGKVQHYNWGGYNFIPQLVNISNIKKIPFAEYWMGAHPSQSATILIDKKDVPLASFLKQHGPTALGDSTYKTFGDLPYLLKILDVKQMLSIQVHPSKEQATIEFEREESAGVPLTAPHRNYKDRNHKPEMMIALSDFWLLHGFKAETDLQKKLSSVAELHFLKDLFVQQGYKGLFSFIMQLNQQEVNKHLHQLSLRILPLYEKNVLEKSSEDFWAARAIQSFCTNNTYDRGIFCIYLFNLVHLKKGEGVFQPAGMPHAYLEGQNVEIMANSDNVLRAGLTDKHIDVGELVKHTVCEPTCPQVFTETGPETSYPNSAAEFALHKYSLHSQAVSFETASAEIIFVLNGRMQIETVGEDLILEKGDSAFLIAQTKVRMHSATGAVIFRATVGRV